MFIEIGNGYATRIENIESFNVYNASVGSGSPTFYYIEFSLKDGSTQSIAYDTAQERDKKYK